jgi:hypothetical protein
VIGGAQALREPAQIRDLELAIAVGERHELVARRAEA